jgi:hypothetical protein
MAAINEAYAKGDLPLLILFMEQAEREEKILRESLEEKLVRLKAEYEKICSAVEKLKRELAAVLASDTMRLRQMAEDSKMEGKDLLSGLTGSVMEKGKEKQAELDTLIAEYQDMVSQLK